MNLLLDTQVFLWWDSQDKALKADTSAAIADPANQVFVSAASVWEIAIKRRLGKLEFRGSAVAAIGANGFHELPVLPIDAENAGALAWPHNDPFDRMLVAQARRLTFTLSTADAAIRAFPDVAQIWAG
ncbi:MAG: type II toxin-antitoxin system VapC family toxin [Acetobacteraceae bacterium]